MLSHQNLQIGSIQLNFELLRKLDSFLGVRTSDLASDIADQYSRKIPGYVFVVVQFKQLTSYLKLISSMHTHAIFIALLKVTNNINVNW